MFDIFLPRCLNGSSTQAAPVQLPASACSGTILVVEDEPVVCTVTQILLTSGYTSGDTVGRMLDEGAVQGFLPKPYELHELLGAINQLMKRP